MRVATFDVDGLGIEALIRIDTDSFFSFQIPVI